MLQLSNRMLKLILKTPHIIITSKKLTNSPIKSILQQYFPTTVLLWNRPTITLCCNAVTGIWLVHRIISCPWILSNSYTYCTYSTTLEYTVGHSLYSMHNTLSNLPKVRTDCVCYCENLMMKSKKEKKQTTVITTDNTPSQHG